MILWLTVRCCHIHILPHPYKSVVKTLRHSIYILVWHPNHIYHYMLSSISRSCDSCQQRYSVLLTVCCIKTVNKWCLFVGKIDVAETLVFVLETIPCCTQTSGDSMTKNYFKSWLNSSRLLSHWILMAVFEFLHSLSAHWSTRSRCTSHS